MKETSTEEKYRALLAQQESEGLSRQEAAARAGIKPSTLTWWRCEIARLDRERGRARKGDSAMLVPVAVRDVAPMASVAQPFSSPPYEVVLGSGRVVRVPRDFEAAQVQALVRALEVVVPC